MSGRGRQEPVWPGAGRQHGQRAQGPRVQEQGHQARQGEDRGGGADGDPGVWASAGLLHVRDDRTHQHQHGESAHSQEGPGGGGRELGHRDVSIESQ